MKFLAVFVAVLAVAAAAPRKAQFWDVNQLSEAINSPNTDAALKPYLIEALNTLMDAMWNGSPITAVPIVTPVGVVEPVSPASNVQLWNVDQLSEAINSPSTNPALKPYLIEALNTLMDALWNGSPITAVPVVTPIGVVEPISPAGILPGGNVVVGGAAEITPVGPVTPGGAIEILPVHPVVPGGAAEVFPVHPAVPGGAAEVFPTEVIEHEPLEVAEKPVVPAPVAEVPASQPLVQLIINVNTQTQEVVIPGGVAEVPVTPAGVSEIPVVAPTPVHVVEAPVVPVSPVAVVDTPQVVSPIQVVDTPQVVSPIGVVEQPAAVEPISVVEPALPVVVEPIAVGEPALPAPVLPAPVNPIDVISISPPEFNPVDVISPVPAVEAGSNDGILV